MVEQQLRHGRPQLAASANAPWTRTMVGDAVMVGRYPRGCPAHIGQRDRGRPTDDLDGRRPGGAVVPGGLVGGVPGAPGRPSRSGARTAGQLLPRRDAELPERRVQVRAHGPRRETNRCSPTARLLSPRAASVQTRSSCGVSVSTSRGPLIGSRSPVVRRASRVRSSHAGAGIAANSSSAECRPPGRRRCGPRGAGDGRPAQPSGRTEAASTTTSGRDGPRTTRPRGPRPAPGRSGRGRGRYARAARATGRGAARGGSAVPRRPRVGRHRGRRRRSRARWRPRTTGGAPRARVRQAPQGSECLRRPTAHQVRRTPGTEHVARIALERRTCRPTSVVPAIASTSGGTHPRARRTRRSRTEPRWRTRRRRGRDRARRPARRGSVPGRRRPPGTWSSRCP